MQNIPSHKILALLVLAAVLRGGLALLAMGQGNAQSLMTPDSVGYLALSESLTHEGTFQQEGRAEIFRTPGYPLWISLVSRWVPISPLAAAAIASILVDLLLVYLTVRLGCLLAGPGVAWWAGLTLAITPVSIVASIQLLSDSLYAFALTLALLAMVRYAQSPHKSLPILAGVALVAACYIRPVGLAMVVLFFMTLTGMRRHATHRANALAGFVVVIAIGLAPWVVRNVTQADYEGFSSFATDSIYRHTAPEIQARVTGESPRELRDAFGRRELSRQATLEETPGAMARWRVEQAKPILLSHPGLFLQTHITGCAGFFLPGATDVTEVAGLTTGQRGTLDVLHKQGLLAATNHYFGNNRLAMALAIPCLAIYLIKAMGIILLLCRGGLGLIRRRDGETKRFPMPGGGWLCVAAVALSAILAGVASTPRFRVPVEPILSIAAAAGWVWLFACVKRTPKPLDANNANNANNANEPASEVGV